MKIYSVNGSHNCRRVLATADHLGLDYELKELDLKGGEHKQPAFFAVNPNGKVPALEDGDFKLWESTVIMQYLASKKPAAGLFPDDPKTRADIARWQMWDAVHLGRATSTFAFEKLFKPMFMQQEPNANAVAQATKDFHLFAPVLNGQLEGKKYVTGDALTLADFSIGASFQYAIPAGIPVDDYKHILAWNERLNEIDAWRKSAPQLPKS